MSSFKAAETFKDGLWYHSKLEDGLAYSYKVDKLIFEGTTKFQKIAVISTVPFQRALITDGIMQSSEADEYVYHECLVHPVMLAHPNPKRVFIAGGGEGATLREVLRHSGVEQATMVDIDGEIVEMCKEHLPNHSKGAYNDPRTKLVIADALEYLQKSPDMSFDVIILDLCDPLEGTPCCMLYTEEFYTMCKKKLTDSGILITQSGCASVHEADSSSVGVFSAVYCTLKKVFPQLCFYTSFIPSFGAEWGWTVAHKNAGAGDISMASDIDQRLASRGLTSLRYYDQGSHTRMFSLPKPVRKALNSETRIISDKNPMYMTSSNKGIV